jgi:peroxiredoxin
MKRILVLILFLSATFRSYTQKAEPLDSDTVEYQNLINGQSLKVVYKGNGRTLTIAQKNKLLDSLPSIRREFVVNIRNGDTISEVHFFPARVLTSQTHTKEQPSHGGQLDIGLDNNGKNFPMFDWIDLDNNHLSTETLKGKVVVLNFWDLSCIPCIAEINDLNNLYRDIGDPNVEFIAVSNAGPEQLKKFLANKAFSYKQVARVDSKAFFSPFPGWPVHVVVDQTGIIRFIAFGKQKNLIEKLSGAIHGCLIVPAY